MKGTSSSGFQLLVLLALSGCGGHSGVRPTIVGQERSPAAVLPTSGEYKGEFNNDDQGHADFCTRLTKPTVPLRYSDGTPSGFNLTPSILQPQSGSGVWCPEPGLARLDARETIIAEDGKKMFFHRGGWGFAGNDPLSAVHYGHVRTEDVNTVGLRFYRSDSASRLPGVPSGRWLTAKTEPWHGKGQQSGNGTPCASLAKTPLRVSVQSIPADMHYLNSRQTGSIPYMIYGNPSTDLGPASDRDRGVKYTILQWSWINVRGGGVARALVRDGADFFPCRDVPAILLASVSDAATKKQTGWVQAAYGAVLTGRKELIHGWIVSAHRRGSEPVVKHLDEARAPGPESRGLDSIIIALRDDSIPLTARDTSGNRPFMLLYTPPANLRSATAALVFAGGAYNHIAIEKEGLPAARWLNSLGITAFIVRYRLGPQYHHPAMLEDAARAIRIVRSRAKEWELDTARIGVVGFSAGGHLASTLATHFDSGSLSSTDPVERASSKPSFVLLVYPVITMKDPFANKGSRRDLLGPNPRSDVLDSLSSDTRVTSGLSPTFIVAATDDKGVPVDNALLFYNAARGAGVPVELHLFQSGGHGFGLAPNNPVLSQWPGLAESWLRHNGWLAAH